MKNISGGYIEPYREANRRAKQEKLDKEMKSMFEDTDKYDLEYEETEEVTKTQEKKSENDEEQEDEKTEESKQKYLFEDDEDELA